MRSLSRAALLTTLLVSAPAAVAYGVQERLSQREGKALVEEHLSLDPRGGEDEGLRDEILARLEAHGELSAREAARWRKMVLDLAARGPKLDKGEGEQSLWEDEGRGMFLVGGETRRTPAAAPPGAWRRPASAGTDSTSSTGRSPAAAIPLRREG
ncbi:MAG: hypothetical protein QGI46_11910 [Planctomycetota bacterium]|nr:hypothetical protein [Planctomycetota bacterium]